MNGESLKVVIIGGVAGGASAAARLRRRSEEAEIIILEKSGHISFANCGLPYYLGDIITDREKLLLQTPESMWKRFRIDVRVNSEALELRPLDKMVVVENKQDGSRYELSYDKLILAPGSRPIRPNLPGLDLPRVFTLRNMEDCDRIKNFLQKTEQKAGSEADRPKKVLIVGGGFIGLEMMENLSRAGAEVTAVELGPQVMAPLDPEMAAPLKSHLREKGIDLRLGTGLEAINPAAGDQLDCRFSDGTNLTADMVLLSIGVLPDSALAGAAGLRLTERGAIMVDSFMRSSEPDIYAVGDAVSVRDFLTGQPTVVPLAGPANRQGRLAADNIIYESTHERRKVARGPDGQPAGRPQKFHCPPDETWIWTAEGDSGVWEDLADDLMEPVTGGGAQPERLKSYDGTQGTLICRVFELTVGATGLNEKILKKDGRHYDKVYLHPGAHAAYYPGAEVISLKVLFDPDDGRLLGAQAVGKDGVDKRLDVLATAMRAGLNVRDLQSLELAYAPPYSSAKDPVNLAGFLAANVLDGHLRQIFADELSTQPEPPILVDVRSQAEHQRGSLPGAINIPVDELRERLGELPPDRPIVVFCQIGLRGYLAYRLLSQHGFRRLRNLSGGYRSWLAQQEAAA